MTLAEKLADWIMYAPRRPTPFGTYRIAASFTAPKPGPRWIVDQATNELFERQPDGGYRVAYRLTPVQEK